MFGHQGRDMVVMVRGGDFVSTEDIEVLRWLESMILEKFGITADIIGHDGASKKQIKVLNRFTSVNDRLVHVRT